MAAAEPYDYLPGTGSADYNFTLAVTAQRVWTERGEFPGQKRHVSDGDTHLTTTRNTTPRFWFVLIFNGLSEGDAGTIFDFFFDTAKGKGIARSFKYDHPKDGHTYLVKFDESVTERVINAVTVHRYGRIRLIVVDRVND